MESPLIHFEKTELNNPGSNVSEQGDEPMLLAEPEVREPILRGAHTDGRTCRANREESAEGKD